MIDLGAHGMYLTEWIMGMPVKASSAFTVSCDLPEVKARNKDRVEDNAVTVMSFENGAIAVNETGFVSNHYPMTLEIGGEKGMAFYGPNGVTKRTNATEGKLVNAEMCSALPSPIVQFLNETILEGCGMKEAKALTHLMVEAYR
jgi:predicted dehydrogenase